jgi:hypothetical protein
VFPLCLEVRRGCASESKWIAKSSRNECAIPANLSTSRQGARNHVGPMSALWSLSYVGAWARAFACTQLVEVPIYIWLIPAPRVRAFAASACTHPLVWFAFPLLARAELLTPWFRIALPGLSYRAWGSLAEVFAWLAEAALMSSVASFRRALCVSFAANGASVMLGMVSRSLWQLP